MRPSTPASAACALLWTLVGCACSSAGQFEAAEQGELRVGRKCQLQGVRYALDARFEIVGPEVAELDTGKREDAAIQLVPGSYAITIRPDFTLWRDIAVAQVQVAAELAAEAQQHFEISSGVSVQVAYQLTVDGETATFDAD